MATEPRLISDEEYENATRAAEEMAGTGTTERRCLRCGSRFLYEDHPSHFVLRCESCDFRFTGRGL